MTITGGGDATAASFVLNTTRPVLGAEKVAENIPLYGIKKVLFHQGTEKEVNRGWEEINVASISRINLSWLKYVTILDYKKVCVPQVTVQSTIFRLYTEQEVEPLKYEKYFRHKYSR